jgi:hypothetical protein
MQGWDKASVGLQSWYRFVSWVVSGSSICCSGCLRFPAPCHCLSVLLLVASRLRLLPLLVWLATVVATAAAVGAASCCCHSWDAAIHSCKRNVAVVQFCFGSHVVVGLFVLGVMSLSVCLFRESCLPSTPAIKWTCHSDCTLPWCLLLRLSPALHSRCGSSATLVVAALVCLTGYLWASVALVCLTGCLRISVAIQWHLGLHRLLPILAIVFGAVLFHHTLHLSHVMASCTAAAWSPLLVLGIMPRFT